MTDETPQPPLDEDGIPILTEVVVPGDAVEIPELDALKEAEPAAETETPASTTPELDEETLTAIMAEVTREMRDALLDDIDNLVRTRIHETIEVMLGQYETTLREHILEALRHPANHGKDT